MRRGYQPRNPMHLRLRKPPAGPRLTPHDLETCARCNYTRWAHEKKQGLIPDHDFVPITQPDEPKATK